MKEKITMPGFSEEELERFRLKIIEIQEKENNIISTYVQLEEREDVKGSDRAINSCLDVNNVVNSRAIRRAKATLQECDFALNRIKNKTFGYCCKTGNLLPTDLLLVNPLLTQIPTTQNTTSK
jgi:RNA polymerase-binding transcription factor DksA